MDDPTQGGAAAMEAPQQASTKTAAPASDTAGSPETAGGDKSWQQAAAAAGPGANTPPTQPQAAAVNSPQQPAPAPPPAVTAVAAPPPEAKPVYPPGLRGFMDKMIDSLAGAPTSKVRQGADGSVYLEHEPVRGQPGFSNGKQWLRIGAEALLGAAAGMSQRGAGSEGAALGAGVQAGQKFQQQRQEAPTQEMVQLANISTLNHQTAANAIELTRKGIEGQQHDIDFSEKQADRLTQAGASQVGHAANLQELTKFMRDTPQFNHDQAKTALYTPVATYGADGKPNGFDIYKKLPGSDDEILPAGTQVPFFNPVKNEIEYQKSAGPLKQGDVNALWAAAGNARHKYQLDQSEIEERNADADAKNNPPEKTETPSATREHNSVAALNEEKLRRLRTGAELPDGTPNPRFETMANAMLNGDILPGDLKREAKGASLDPNEVVGRAMEIAAARGEHFSLPIIEQEHKFASSPKTQAALDGIDRVLGAPGQPGYMDQMLKLAKDADLGTHGALNSASLAVQRFFGSNAAKNFNTSVMETRRSIAGLIGNPLLGGSETDKKLQQADAMLGESPTMENLEGAANVLKQALATQRQSIVSNNRYLRQRYGSASGQGQQPAAALTNLHTNPTTGQTIGWNGQQYVDTKTDQAVK
jgi:hypothetical protein